MQRKTGKSSNTSQVYMIFRERLKGSVLAVTVISPPPGISSDTFFSKFGRVACSSCGGAWKYICLVGVESEGFLIWLHGTRKSTTERKRGIPNMSCFSVNISMSSSTVNSRLIEKSRDSPPHTGQSGRFSCSKV